MTWALRDLKANSGIWAGVFIVLVVTQTLLCAMSVSMGVNSYYQGLSVKTRDPAKSLASALSLVFLTVIVLGCLVIKQTLQASIRQRRRGLALISLLGATPKQILLLTLLQVIILVLPASLVAVALSPALAGRILDWYSTGMRIPVHFAFTWRGFPRSALTGLAVGLATAILATSRTLRDLGKMTPVRVVRRAEESESIDRPRHRRGLVSLFLGLALLLLPLPVFAYLSHSGSGPLDPKQVQAVISAVGSGPLFAILLLLIALARSGGTSYKLGHSTLDCSGAVIVCRLADSAFTGCGQESRHYIRLNSYSSDCLYVSGRRSVGCRRHQYRRHEQGTGNSECHIRWNLGVALWFLGSVACRPGRRDRGIHHRRSGS